MFCTKCGTQINDGAKFCTKCGKPVEGVKSSNVVIEKNFDVPITKNENNIEIKKEKKGNGWIVALVALLIVVILAGCGVAGYFVFYRGGGINDYDKLLEKAETCVKNEEYEDAITYYLNAISQKDDDPDTYIALAEIYQGQDDYDKAIRILETGADKTDDKSVKKALEKIKNIESDDPDMSDSAAEVSDDSAESDSENTGEKREVFTGQKKDIDIDVRQVDTSNFPEVTLYASITDKAGNVIEGLDYQDFNIQEIVDGTTIDASVNDVYRVLNKDTVNVNLVMDASGSMSSANKITQAKNAATSLIEQMKLDGGDQAEIITFDDYVYLAQEFTNNGEVLKTAIQGIQLGGSTALYDGLYAGLYQTYYEKGAKCVIGFTDGMENASSYTYNDVVGMSKNTGIPVFIIGIGDEYDAYSLQNLANECSGRYYSADVNNLESILEDIYLTIYQEQQDYYVFKYKSADTSKQNEFRTVSVSTSEYSEFSGHYEKSYVPEADMTGAFSGSYVDKDYMIPESNVRAVTEADLAGMSLAELRIARNEIFARHGRQFKDPLLNQWFYSKTWYLNVGTKYAPDVFDKLSKSPLSRMEIDNANFIREYENDMMAHRDIYPNATTTKLSEYDLALSKVVLKTALSQMNNYSSNAILEENKRLVQEAINKPEVQH